MVSRSRSFTGYNVPQTKQKSSATSYCWFPFWVPLHHMTKCHTRTSDMHERNNPPYSIHWTIRNHSPHLCIDETERGLDSGVDSDLQRKRPFLARNRPRSVRPALIVSRRVETPFPRASGCLAGHSAWTYAATGAEGMWMAQGMTKWE
jgi:hypothetical protein